MTAFSQNPHSAETENKIMQNPFKDDHAGIVSLAAPFNAASLSSYKMKTEVHQHWFNLSDDVVVSFEPVAGGGIETNVHQPAVGSSFVTLKPFGLGASRWFSIEAILDVSKLKSMDQVIPTLNASAPRSTALFAVLRLVMPDGRAIDTSSTQIVLGKTRRAFALPIVIDDMSPNTLQDAASARLIFFVEARNVPLDIHAISVSGVEAEEPVLKMPEAVMNEHAANPESGVRKASFKTAGLERHELRWNAPVGDDFCRIDVDSAADQHVAIHSRNDALVIDFSMSSNSRWRTLELRMPDLKNTGDVALHLRIGMIAPDLTCDDPVKLVVRVYDEDWATWSDKELPMLISNGMQEEDHVFVVDLSHMLPDVKTQHNIGILCFFPPQCKALELRRFEVTKFDRRI